MTKITKMHIYLSIYNIKYVLRGLLVGWLNWFKAKLSLKRHWQGLRSLEVEKEGDYI